MLSFGQLFGSNFWSSLKSQPSESIEKLVKNPNTSIEELLDDSDLIQECKNGNKNLINYLTRDKIKELINFITIMPEEDEHNRGHKYPFLSSEVFSCDITEVIDKFFTAPCDDAKPNAEEQHEDDEDATKIESTFEKDDNEDSGSDSEEEMPMYAVTDKKETDQEKPKDTIVENPNSSEDTNKDEAENKSEEHIHLAVNIQSDGPVLNIVNVQPDIELDSKDQVVEDSKSLSDKSQENTEDLKTEEKIIENENKTLEKNEDSIKGTQKPEEENKKLNEEIISNGNSKQEVKTEETSQNIIENIAESINEPLSRNLEDDDTVISEATTEISVKETKQNNLSTNKYDLLDYLTKFIETEDEVNDVLSGYFARLCNILIQKKGEDIAKYFYTNKEKLLKLADHSYSKSISEIAVKVLDINVDKLEFDKEEIMKIRAEFLERLLDMLKKNKSETYNEYSLNIFQIFSDLTYKKALDDGTKVIKYFEMLTDPKILNTLGEIIHLNSLESSSIAAIRIVNALISHLRDHLSTNSKKRSIIDGSNFADDECVLIKETPEENETNQNISSIIATHPLVEFFKLQVINHIVDELDNPPENCVIDLQYAKQQYLLGKKRLSIINLMESLIDLEDAGIREKIMETSFYTKLFDLFLEFPFNTFLHLHVENIFNAIIKDSSTSIETKLSFLSKTQILQKLPCYWSENQVYSMSSSREFRHSYLAFTTKMANTLTELAKTFPELAKLLDEEEWKNFQLNEVDVINEKNAIVLAKGKDKKDTEDDRFKELDERDDLDDDDDEDEYPASRKGLRDAIQNFGILRGGNERGDDEEEEDKEDEDNLFSGLNTRDDDDEEVAHHKNRYEDDDDDKNPLQEFYENEDDEKHIDESEKIKEIEEPEIEEKQEENDGVSEDKGYYDNSYWQINQYNIEELLRS